MLGVENQDDSPKRRSTFYVSLDGESRQVTKLPKTVSLDPDKYSCNTFPIGTTKIPNAHLTRTMSNHDTLTNGVVEKKCGVESRGKVQSLTRIFEASKEEGPEQKKKVERTRSFKTIERFQSRFTGRKDAGRKDNRLNNTIPCIETENSDVRRKSRNEDKCRSDEKCRNEEKCRSEEKFRSEEKSRDEVERRAVPKIKSRTRESRSILEQTVTKQHNNNNNTTTFANLIRRTHSTKLTRSTSALVRPARHNTTGSSGDDSANHVDFRGDNEKEILEDSIGRNECPEGCAFEETDIDGGVHSGE